MAMDPRISLAVQPAGILQAAQQGLQFGQQYAQQEAMNPLQQEALKAQTGQAQAQTSKLDMAKQIAGAGYMTGAIKQLQQLPQEQRWPTAQLHLAKMQAMGLDTTGVDESHMSDEGLQQAYSAVAPMAQMAQQGQRQGLQSTGTPLIGVKNGNVVQVATTFNPNTGDYESREIPTGLTDTQAANRYGMTAGAANQQAAERASLLGGVATRTAVNTIEETADPRARAEALAMTQKTQAEAVETKKAEILNNADVAAAQLPRLGAVLDLLKDGSVNTGGVNQLYNAIANKLNLDTADAETVERAFKKDLLDASESMKGVLVKSDFDLLRGTGADFSISTPANIRILDGMQKKLNNAIIQGKKIVDKNPNYGDAYPFLMEFKPAPNKPEERKQSGNAANPAAPSPKTPAATARTPEAQAEYDRLRKEYQRP